MQDAASSDALLQGGKPDNLTAILQQIAAGASPVPPAKAAPSTDAPTSAPTQAPVPPPKAVPASQSPRSVIPKNTPVPKSTAAPTAAPTKAAAPEPAPANEPAPEASPVPATTPAEAPPATEATPKAPPTPATLPAKASTASGGFVQVCTGFPCFVVLLTVHGCTARLIRPSFAVSSGRTHRISTKSRHHSLRRLWEASLRMATAISSCQGNVAPAALVH